MVKDADIRPVTTWIRAFNMYKPSSFDAKEEEISKPTLFVLVAVEDLLLMALMVS
jgi:hypothetical protein